MFLPEIRFILPDQSSDSPDPQGTPPPPGIGLLRESSLHAALKQHLALPGDEFEVPVGRYVIDIRRGRLLIEVQTGSFTQIRRKLANLLPGHPLTLVYPLTLQKWIVRQDEKGKPVSRRKSPRRGRLEDLFYELVRIPHQAIHPNLELLVLYTFEEEVLQPGEGGGWRRRGWEVVDRRLIEVRGEARFSTPDAYLSVLPEGLPEPFTNPELARSSGCNPRLAGKITYTLRRMGLLEVAGKRGRANLLRRAQAL